MKLAAIFITLVALLFGNSPAAEVRVTGVNDVSLGQWGMNDGDVSAFMDMCIYSNGNSPSGSYGVKVTSDWGSYVLKYGVHQVPYSLFWEDSSTLGTSSGTQLTHNVQLTARRNANTNFLSQLCLLIGNTARLYIKIPKTALEPVPSGQYSGVINIIISNN